MLTVRFEIALALLTGGAARLFYAFKTLARGVSFAVGVWWKRAKVWH